MAMTATRTKIRTLLGSTSWLVADYGIRLLVGLVVGVIVARHFGPEQTGALNYAIAFIACAAPLVTLGLDAVVVHALVVEPARRENILGTAATLRVLAAIGSYGCIVFVSYLFKGVDNFNLYLIAIVALQLVFQIGDIADFEFQSRLNAAAIVKARMIAFLLASIARLMIVAMAGPLILLAAMLAMESAIASYLLFSEYRRQYSNAPSWRWDRVIAGRLLQKAWPLATSGFLLAANAHADKLILGQVSGPTAVGIYFAAYQLSGVWYALAVIIAASAAPGLSRTYCDSRALYDALATRVQAGLTLIAVTIGIAVTLWSKLIVGLLFGPAFETSASVLVIHIWTGIFVFHIHFRSRLLVIEGKQNFIAIFAGLALATNLILNLLLDAHFGAQGAAYASVGSWLTCAIFWPLAFERTRDSTMLFLRTLNPFSWLLWVRR